jgi:hypothetical protein
MYCRRARWSLAEPWLHGQYLLNERMIGFYSKLPCIDCLSGPAGALPTPGFTPTTPTATRWPTCAVTLRGYPGASCWNGCSGVQVVWFERNWRHAVSGRTRITLASRYAPPIMQCILCTHASTCVSHCTTCTRAW